MNRICCQTEQAPALQPQPRPRRLQVEVTTRCNMRCAMCVKSAEGCRIPEAHMDFATFTRLAEAFPHCEAVVLNGIGEPLLHPRLADMVAFARERLPAEAWLGFQTNGLLLTPSLADRLVAAGADTFCISVDALAGAGEKGQGELHGQADVARLEAAFAMLRNAAEAQGRQLQLGVEFVLMADTWRQLPDVVRWAAAQGAGFMVVSHLLPFDAAMQRQSLFNPNTPEARRVFEHWQAKAAAEGLDLHDYFASLWKYAKSPREKRLGELAAGLQEDALARGVWVHLRRLLDWDRCDRRGLEAACAEAAAAAECLGLELRMPPLEAADERRCHFVEQDAAFVTVAGDVSVCQFLWHEVACHMDGQQKFVQPWLFGNLQDAPLSEIWNSQAFEDFRRQVLDYDYPYCANCAFVPCDDIVGESYSFEADCLGHSVPCGHCLWCMGGLQCLL